MADITGNKQPRHSRLLLSIVSLSVLITGWWLITAFQWVNPLYLPAPAQIGHQFLALSESGYMNATLWQHLAASLDRMLKALLLAVITGISLGVLMGLSSRIRGILDPVVELYRPVPPLAYLPLIVIWFGIGETTKILLIWLAILAPVLISTMQGIMAAPGNRIRAVQSLGANRLQVLRYVILPSALPQMLTGIRIGLGVGWSTLVAAELVAAQQGLGFMVQSAAQFLNTGIVITGIAVIAVVALAIELALRHLQQALVPWYGKES
ncbi:taurine ABC transporter permease TauC [Morganella morganii]|uniref:taurine ABC transporter permease TauC n=1 Tax=Morganella morganii TaxID=582 RepID=UPI000E64F3A3|nr:taurine ABC transporter permease TauC [Morganella morganii]